MNYSKELQEVIENAGLGKENILYLTIAQSHLKRIQSGAKKVEFRDVSEYYLKKMVNYNSKDEYIGEKPISHILFQGGYSATAPRLLVEMTDWFIKEINITENSPEVRAKIESIIKESKLEGFTAKDEYLAMILGEIKHSENFKN